MKKLFLLLLVLFSGAVTSCGPAGLCEDPFNHDAWKTATVDSIACVDVNARDESERTPLHSAAGGNKNPEIIALLIEHGADVNAIDEDGATPLHFAAANENPEIIALLILLGADVNARGINDVTPLHVAAKFNKNPEVIIGLILLGAEVNARVNRGNTPLHVAADIPIIRDVLISLGADAKAINEDGFTPSDLARLRGVPFPRMYLEP